MSTAFNCAPSLKTSWRHFTPSSQEAIQRQIDSDEESRRVYESYSAFQKLLRPFSDVGEYAYLKNRDNVDA
ncbi:hypothetical protein HSBAA_65730 [Vreelandella sulfidaeris]|uniref:Uncharacterized protein n=1 Tax=Vreelandella sulfidaeris TaxID=115553 RepID=A0A455UHQ5_9GAMM|nr:hypothetical protein HSBAA_65730 [Halomonas sulfidaeris]